jgi:glyoxylase I family protein
MPVGTSNRRIAGCGVHHIALQTRDWEGSLRLYRDVLGMPVVAEGGTPERPAVLLDIGDGSHMELFGRKDDTPPVDAAAANDPLMHIALATSDARAATELVRQAGYEVTTEPKAIQVGTISAVISFFKGPNGELVEFFETT